MEWTEVIIAVLGSVSVWEIIRYFLNKKAEDKKVTAQASQEEQTATQMEQDIYQELIQDLRTERSEKMEENRKLRERLNAFEDKIRALTDKQARQGRQMEAIRPFLCYDLHCKKRKLRKPSDIEDVDDTPSEDKGNTNQIKEESENGNYSREDSSGSSSDEQAAG